MKAEQLKKSILQNAMEGKLIKEVTSNNSSQFLLEKIKKKKNINLNHSSNNTQNNESLAPFKIPESWTWVKLSEISSLTLGKTPAKSELDFWSSQDYKWITIADMVNGEIINNTSLNISQKAYEEIFKGQIVKKGTLIMSFKLTIGKTSIMGFDGFHNEAIASIVPFYDEENTLRNYLLKILPLISQSGEFKGAIKGKTLNKKTLSNLLIPLPPIEEQRFIVERIDELFKVVDSYDELEKKLESLNNNFPFNMEKSILQYAIQGKLLPQKDNEGSAEYLLNRITRERKQLIEQKIINKVTDLSPIEESEKSLQLPQSWTWVRLGACADIKGGKRIPKGYKMISTPTPYVYLRVSDMKNGSINDNNLQYIEENVYEKIKNYYINKEDLYLTIAGTIGTIGEIPENLDGAILTENAVKISNIQIDKKFLKYLLKSPFVQIQIQNLTTRVAQPKLSIRNIKSLIIPLPPLKEQERIANKVEELLAQKEKLKIII